MGNILGPEPDTKHFASDPLLGDVVEIDGRSVRLVTKLAEGGFSSVYLVHDVTTEEPLVLKRMVAQVCRCCCCPSSSLPS